MDVKWSHQACATCEGHLCDGCTVCLSGRCCRRDNPDYNLPAEGDWDRQYYGTIGALNDNGSTVECHICGVDVVSLANHSLYKHNVTGSEYRALFGLNRTTSLTPVAHQERMSDISKELLSQGKIPMLQGALWTPESRHYASKVPRRSQAKATIGSLSRDRFASMTDDQRRSHVESMQRARMEKTTSEQRQQWGRENARLAWSRRTSEERQAWSRMAWQRCLEKYGADEIQRFTSAGVRRFWSSLTPDERKRQRDARRRFWAKMTPDEKQAYINFRTARWKEARQSRVG